MARLSHWAMALTINLSSSTDRPAIVKKTSFRATLGSSDHRGTFLRLSLVTCPIVRRAPRRSTSGSISSMPRPAIVRLDSSSTPSPPRMSTVIRVRARAPCHDHRWVIERRSGAFDPASFRERYQDALRELVEGEDKRAGDNGPVRSPIPQGHQSDGGLEAQPRAGRRAGAEEGGREQTPRVRRRLQTGVNGCCCYPYSAVAGRRTQLLRSRRLHRPQSEGGKLGRAGADL